MVTIQDLYIHHMEVSTNLSIQAYILSFGTSIFLKFYFLFISQRDSSDPSKFIFLRHYLNDALKSNGTLIIDAVHVILTGKFVFGSDTMAVSARLG